MTHYSIQAATLTRPFQVQKRDLNVYGFMHGGRLITLCDETAYLAAMRHCERDCLTRAIHRARFHAPLHPDEAFDITARPALTGHSSIWVACEVRREAQLVMDALLVFVAVDEGLQPVGVPALVAETEEERQLMEKIRRIRESMSDSQP